MQTDQETVQATGYRTTRMPRNAGTERENNASTNKCAWPIVKALALGGCAVGCWMDVMDVAIMLQCAFVALDRGWETPGNDLIFQLPEHSSDWPLLPRLGRLPVSSPVFQTTQLEATPCPPSCLLSRPSRPGTASSPCPSTRRRAAPHACCAPQASTRRREPPIVRRVPQAHGQRRRA